MENNKKVAGHRGFVLSVRPKKYFATKPQQVFSQITKLCGIKKGMSKADLQAKMKECVGPAMKEYYKKGDNHDRK